jgi:uncharacterized protein
MRAGEGRIRIEVVYAEPEAQSVIELELSANATVADALAAAAHRVPFSGLDLAAAPVGVFGDRVSREYRLSDGDRVEIYRPLVIDPRQARRRRAGSPSSKPLRSSARSRR